MLLCQKKIKKDADIHPLHTFVLLCITAVICHGSSSFINLIISPSTQNSECSRNNKEKNAPPHSSRSAAYAALEASLEL